MVHEVIYESMDWQLSIILFVALLLRELNGETEVRGYAPPRKFEIRSSKKTGNATKTRILLILSLSMGIHLYSAVLDPDLEIMGDGGKAGLQKKFLALRASVWSKNNGRGGPSPGSATVLLQQIILHVVHVVKSACTRSRRVLPHPADWVNYRTVTKSTKASPWMET